MELFFKIIIIRLKKIFVYKSDSLIWLFTNIIRTIIDIIVILTLYIYVPTIKGFNINECFMIYSIFAMVSSLFYMFFSWTLWFSSGYLINGKIIEIINKPVNTLFYLIADNFAYSEIFGFIIGLIIYIYSCHSLQLDIFKSLLLVFTVIPGMIIVTGLFLIIASIAHRFPKIEEGFTPIMTMMDYAHYPITIYPKIIRIILTSIIPFGLIAFYPVAIILNKKISLIQPYFLLPIYSLFFITVGYICFIRSLKKFELTAT